MHLEAVAFQRRLEHTEKAFLVVDSENTFFFTAIARNHALKKSIQLANIARRQMPIWHSGRGFWRTKTAGGLARRICPLEATSIRMAAKDASSKAQGILASIGILHQARREIEGLPQIRGPTFLRIWKTSSIAERLVRHTPSKKHTACQLVPSPSRRYVESICGSKTPQKFVNVKRA